LQLHLISDCAQFNAQSGSHTLNTLGGESRGAIHMGKS
jgi:hypothetical protein